MTDRHNKYGPRTDLVEQIISRAGRLTLQEIDDLTDDWDATNKDARFAARVAVRVAVSNPFRDSAYVGNVVWSAGNTAYFTAWNSGRASAAAAAAAADAAVAAAVAHLEGKYGLTRRDLETLAEPWRIVITDIDPLVRRVMTTEGDQS